MEDWMYEAYRHAKATVEAFDRMFELEEENAKLKAEVKAHEDRINRMFQADMKSIGETITALVGKSK